MPIPVSRTANSRQTSRSLCDSTRTRTATSPRSVNLIPFPARFSRTCRKRTWSPTRPSGTSGGTRHEKQIPFSLARTVRTCAVWSKTRRRLNGADSNSSFPDSILAESNRSLSSAKSRSAESLAVCRQSWTVGVDWFRQRQVDHAEDGVHGRAELVADVGQEAALAWLAASAASLGLAAAPPCARPHAAPTARWHPSAPARPACAR